MNSDLNFNSQFSDYFHNFILEKRGLGCKYETEAAALRLFDRYVCKSGYVGTGISKALFENWTNRRPYEREKTCENRTHILTQFCKYVVRMGGTGIYFSFSTEAPSGHFLSALYLYQ